MSPYVVMFLIIATVITALLLVGAIIQWVIRVVDYYSNYWWQSFLAIACGVALVAGTITLTAVALDWLVEL